MMQIGSINMSRARNNNDKAIRNPAFVVWTIAEFGMRRMLDLSDETPIVCHVVTGGCIFVEKRPAA